MHAGVNASRGNSLHQGTLSKPERSGRAVSAGEPPLVRGSGGDASAHTPLSLVPRARGSWRAEEELQVAVAK